MIKVYIFNKSNNRTLDQVTAHRPDELPASDEGTKRTATSRLWKTDVNQAWSQEKKVKTKVGYRENAKSYRIKIAEMAAAVIKTFQHLQKSSAVICMFYHFKIHPTRIRFHNTHQLRETCDFTVSIVRYSSVWIRHHDWCRTEEFTLSFTTWQAVT